MSDIPAVEIRGLVKDYRMGLGGRRLFRALKGISFSVKCGEVFGFLGPNGAGKSTALKVLLSFLKPTSGCTLLYGRDSRQALTRKDIGYLPETAQYPDYLTAFETVMLYGRLSGMGGAALKRRAASTLEQVGLGADMSKLLKYYSKGMLQRVGLAQAIVHEPRCLVLDEPASGLDPLGRREVREIIQQLRAKGMTILFSSHELTEVEAVCDTVAIIDHGTLCATGALDAVLAPYAGSRTRAEALETWYVATIRAHEHPGNN